MKRRKLVIAVALGIAALGVGTVNLLKKPWEPPLPMVKDADLAQAQGVFRVAMKRNNWQYSGRMYHVTLAVKEVFLSPTPTIEPGDDIFGNFAGMIVPYVPGTELFVVGADHIAPIENAAISRVKFGRVWIYPISDENRERITSFVKSAHTSLSQ